MKKGKQNEADALYVSLASNPAMCRAQTLCIVGREKMDLGEPEADAFGIYCLLGAVAEIAVELANIRKAVDGGK